MTNLPGQPVPQEDIDKIANNQEGQGRRLVVNGITDDALGKVVRATWVDYCKAHGDTNPRHIAPWEDLPGPEKEVDRLIGRAVAIFLLERL